MRLARQESTRKSLVNSAGLIGEKVDAATRHRQSNHEQSGSASKRGASKYVTGVVRPNPHSCKRQNASHGQHQPAGATVVQEYRDRQRERCGRMVAWK